MYTYIRNKGQTITHITRWKVNTTGNELGVYQESQARCRPS